MPPISPSRYNGRRVRIKGEHKLSGECGTIVGQWPQDSKWEIMLDSGKRAIVAREFIEAEQKKP